MKGLSQKKVHSLLGFIRGCYARRDVDSFARYIISELPKLLRCDITGSNEGMPLKKITWLCDLPDVPLPNPEIFEKHMQEHPVINNDQKNKDGQAKKIADFQTKKEIHRLRLYNQLYRRFYVKQKIALVRSATGSPHIIGIAFNASLPAFRRRDRLILNLIRPHLLQAYRNAQEAPLPRRELTLIKRVNDVIGVGAIVLGSNGRVKLMTAQARNWLKSYFVNRARHADELPEEIQTWIERQTTSQNSKNKLLRPLKPLVVDRRGKRLIIRLFSEPHQIVLILKEQRTPLQPKDLELLGLSPREAEVLFWIAQGKTNSETAAILTASVRTVGKHLERIYQKLGVETRTAAAMLALTLLS